jgi:tol-pal system protein YbgF
MASILGLLAAGCEGDLPVRLMQRDLDSVRSEVAAVSKTAEGERMFTEERIGKLEAELRGTIGKALRERQEALQEFMRSQASLSTKLDELAEEARSTRGRVEELGHRIAELNKRVDAVGEPAIGQMGRRLDGLEKQLGQVVATAQEAKMTSQTAAAAAQGATAIAQQATAASEQTALQVTDALQQMADQTNAAVQHVSASTQLALTEARKAMAAQQGQLAASPASQPALPVIRAPSSPPTPPPAAPAIASPPPAPPVVKVPGPPPPAAPKAVTAPPPPRASTPRPAVSAATPGDLYKTALNDYTRGNYDLAIDGFRSYITLHPKTSLLPNARYWLAESFYSQKNYGQAIKEFELLIAEHPDNPKVASAMLKQGYAYLETGDMPRGRTVLNDLLKRFPKSQEARLAKERLNQIKSGPERGSELKGASRRAP